MIDLHCHVLPGIDDGPATIEGALEIARLAAAGGTRVLVATPHVNWRYRNDAATIAERVAELNERLASEEILTVDGRVLEVRAGAEIALTLIPELGDAQLAALGLGGGPWLLVEPPFTPVAPNLEAMLLELLAEAGIRPEGARLPASAETGTDWGDTRSARIPKSAGAEGGGLPASTELRSFDGRGVVIAHPERCPAFQRDPPMLERLVRAGMLTSVTAGSLGGRFGGEARRLALALAREGLLHNVASDAHDAVDRPPEIAAELEQAGLTALGPWLTGAVPAAILDGRRPSPAPVQAPADAEPARRRWWRSLRG